VRAKLCSSKWYHHQKGILGAEREHIKEIRVFETSEQKMKEKMEKKNKTHFTQQRNFINNNMTL
jgi:hypothetical protein